MDRTEDNDTLQRATRSSFCLKKSLSRVLGGFSSRQEQPSIAPPPIPYVATSLHDPSLTVHEYLAQPEKQRGTVFYLAYGSNLSNETFRGKRGIKPLSQVNVQVPSLRLTFDLPGLPYAEPCFANSGTRDAQNDRPSLITEVSAGEKTPLLDIPLSSTEYRKDSWHKGLIGVVYEVTPEDYAHIIATEGGGASYHDILVDCHAFVSSDPATPVPQAPTLPAFKAHTLFAPAAQDGDTPPKDGGRFQRPDTSYAQPSARYLKLITDGAAECGLPYEYQHYLHALRPYTVTSNKQRVGQFVFLSIWLPFIMLCFALGRQFADKDGLTPTWLRQLTAAIFKACWVSYDGFFKPLFGDGERSIPDGGDKATEGKVQPAEGEVSVMMRDVEKAG